jgi:toxin ParE1/3/4
VADAGKRHSLTPLARSDLRRIWRWIARESGSDRADAVLRALEDRFRLAAAMPMVGRPRSDLGAELRCITVRPFLVFYRPTQKGALVVRVIDGRRDLETLFDNET